MDRIVRFFASNTLLVNLIMIFLFFAGILSSTSINREMYPSVDMDKMVIYVTYPGASSRDVEMNAVIPIEKELRKISGIRYFSSYSIENLGTIVLFLDYDLQNKQAVKDEVYRNITSSNIPSISEDVDTLKVLDLNPKMMGIMHVAIMSRGDSEPDEHRLNSRADKMEELLLKVEGVSSVRKYGYREREVHINVDLEKMDSYYVSLNNVVDSIRARNVRATGGTLQSLQNEQTIVTIGEFEDPLDVRDVIIRSNFEGKKIRIQDIANVSYGFKKTASLTRVNGKRAVILEIVKKENADIITTAENVKNFLVTDPLSNTDFKAEVINDLSDSISSMLNAVLINAAIGFGLVVLVLLFFLNLRTSFWIAVAIPISLMITLIGMNLYGVTLNLVSIAAVVTILGMLVDDGIVIGESIFVERERGLPPTDAAVTGVRKVIAPVTVSITTTIVAFLPMLAIKGMMGKVIFIFPLVITVALVASLLEGYFILPNHLIHGSNKEQAGKTVKVRGGGWFSALEQWYTRFLGRVLKLRYFMVLIIIAGLVGTIFISRETIRGFVLFWDDSSDRIYINLEAPDGTSQEYMDTLSLRVEEDLREIIPGEEMVSTRIILGTHDVRPGDLKGVHENWSQIIVVLVPRTERDRTAEKIIRDLRKEINTETHPAFTQVLYEKMSLGPPMGEPVNIKIIGKDMVLTGKIQKEIEEYLGTLPGVFDITNDQKEGKEELNISFDYERLAQLSLNVASVAQTVRVAYEGTVATSIETIDDTLDFRVQVDEHYKRDRRFIENLLIPNHFGRLIRLGEVARIEKQTGKSVINHYNGDRVITITANVDENRITSSQVAEKVLGRFSKTIRDHPEISITMGGEAKETEESLGGLGRAFAIAIVMIYFMLTILFRSVSQPLLIMITVPFSVIGALLAFTLHGIPLTFMGIVGIIGLSGVVVNDNVVMIDFINREIRENREFPIQRIIDGARQRLRPVILTTLTTVLGLLPTVYGVGGTSNAIVPTVMAMAYGLLFATVITLLFVPSIYMIHMDIQKLLGRR